MKIELRRLAVVTIASLIGVGCAHRAGTAGAPQRGPGGLTADQIRTTVRANIGSVQGCYERGLERRSTLAGTVTIALVVGADGRVSGAEVADDTTGDVATAQCVARAVRSWSFPRPDPPGLVSIRYPFNLRQTGG